MTTRNSGNDQQLHTQLTAQQADNPNQDSGNSPPRLTHPLSTSPKTTKSQQGAPAPPTPDTTPPKRCTRLGCHIYAFDRDGKLLNPPSDFVRLNGGAR